jgi:nitroimidazol reductase NimA-like FMN-containing flavoprotein (pyridoxamine 5'-phosphate oxidase superfamily)
MTLDPNTRNGPMDRLETLDARECHSLLATHSMGRVAFTERALPAIRPVNYTLQGNHIVLRTQADGLAARLDGQVVAFEIDEVDVESQSGWSVVVTGTARVLREPTDLVRLDAVPAYSWAGPDHHTAVCITPGQVTGRRILPHPDVA